MRFNSDLGKHGDTGTSEVEVVRAVLEGRADAGAIGSPFWKTVQAEHWYPKARSPKSGPHRRTITACLRRVLILIVIRATVRGSLSGMSYDNPSHRAVLEAEGLHHWESRTSTATPPCARPACARDFSPMDGQVSCRVGRTPRLVLRAVEDRRQAIGMRSFALKGATRRSESIGQRKNVPGNQKVGILGAHRMPIHAIGRDGDFRYQIGARKRDTLRRKTTQRDAADHPVLFADLSSSRKWRNSAASLSVETVAASRTRNPSARARSMPFHALTQVPVPRCDHGARASDCRG